MRYVTRKHALIGVLVLSTVAVGVVAVSVCENDDYTIWLRRLPSDEPVSWFVNLTADDLAAYPLIRNALDAYQNPGAYPGARFEGDYLLWRIVTRPGDTTVMDTSDFLGQRYGGRPYPVILTTGDGVYYSWEVSVTDPGPLGPCR